MMTINCKGKLLDVSRPLVMGILNVTPDSFYASSRKQTDAEISQRIETILKEGASIVDVGGCSTRPGAEVADETEEMKRLEPALRILKEHYSEVVVSIDTFRSSVALKAVNDFGVAIVNDVSGGQLDENMFETVASLHVPYILTHSKGTPKTMQQMTDYTDMMEEIMLFFSQKVQQLRLLGVCDIVLDPGFGFAKTTEQNYSLMKHLKQFSAFGIPLLVGISRKGMIWKLLECSPDESLNGTSVLNMVALMNGASILRVHDVKAAVEAVKIFNKLNEVV